MSAPTNTTGANVGTAIDTHAAAKAPVAAPAATGVALSLAIGLIALGAIAGRDVLIAIGVITGTPWITAALSFVDGLTAQAWMLPAGIAAAALGLLLLFAAVKPRRHTHRPLRATDTWITRRDIARLARSAAQPITGVAAATTRGSGRRLTVTVTPLAGFDAAALTNTVQTTVTEALAPLATPPRVRTRLKEQEST
jgi:uncharacterized protein DUF6286